MGNIFLRTLGGLVVILPPALLGAWAQSVSKSPFVGPAVAVLSLVLFSLIIQKSIEDDKKE